MSGPREVRRVPRAAANLNIRATTTQPMFSQPTDVIALTTTFTPPTSCFENILTMLPPPLYEIWNMEPVPVENNTVAACYPTEFLESYTTVQSYNSVLDKTLGSSVVPAMSPFVCPQHYCTVFAEAKNYIACCPTSYQFHPPETTSDRNRPAYGGTCFSDLPYRTTVPVIGYDEDGNTASKGFSTSASGAQAFAHPIDGWALTSPTIGCPAARATLSSSESGSGASSDAISSGISSISTSTPAPTSPPSSSSGASSGVIAGASIGGVAGLAALAGLLWFFLAYRRKHAANAGIPKDAHQMSDGYEGAPKVYPHYAASPAAYNNHDAYSNHEINEANYAAGAGLAPGPQDEHPWQTQTQAGHFNNGHGAFEMAAVNATELPAEGKQDGDAKVTGFHGR